MTPKIKATYSRQLVTVTGQQNIDENVILQLLGTLREGWLGPLPLSNLLGYQISKDKGYILAMTKC